MTKHPYVGSIRCSRRHGDRAVLSVTITDLAVLPGDLRMHGALPLEEFSRGAALAARWTQGVIGPETKEYLGGLSIIEAPDLDAALAWGCKAAEATTLPIEVRPFFSEG